MNVNREMLAFLRKQYPVGTRIRLDSMQDPYAPVEAGTTGKLDYIDDAGQFHMKWDNGRVLALIVPGPARFFGLFGRESDYILPWESIARIGGDIVLIEGAAEIRRDRQPRRGIWG